MSDSRKFCIYSSFSDSWVKNLRFSDSGVAIHFTKREESAARVESRDVADYLARVVPQGSVMEHSGNKPSIETVLAEHPQ